MRLCSTPSDEELRGVAFEKKANPPFTFDLDDDSHLPISISFTTVAYYHLILAMNITDANKTAGPLIPLPFWNISSANFSRGRSVTDLPAIGGGSVVAIVSAIVIAVGFAITAMFYFKDFKRNEEMKAHRQRLSEQADKRQKELDVLEKSRQRGVIPSPLAEPLTRTYSSAPAANSDQSYIPAAASSAQFSLNGDGYVSPQLTTSSSGFQVAPSSPHRETSIVTDSHQSRVQRIARDEDL